MRIYYTRHAHGHGTSARGADGSAAYVLDGGDSGECARSHERHVSHVNGAHVHIYIYICCVLRVCIDIYVCYACAAVPRLACGAMA